MQPDTRQDDNTFRKSPMLNVLQKWLPSRGNVLFTLLLFALVFGAGRVGALPLSAPTAVASPPNTFAYQGRLADAGGTPLTGTYTMAFRLYNSAAGGAPLWEEQWTGPNSVKASDGLFNIMLGSLIPIPQDVVTSNGSLWLGITIGTDSEMTPRVQLGSVPFAVQALTVPDGSVTASKLADGSVTQAKLAASINLPIPDGSITTAKLSDGSVTGAKQTITTFQSSDSTFKQLNGAGQINISEFTFDNVPAGTVYVMITLFSKKENTVASPGSITVQVDGKAPIYEVPLDNLRSDSRTQLTLHGALRDFAGGQLVIRVNANTQYPGTNVTFGESGGDYRLGRDITVIAGL